MGYIIELFVGYVLGTCLVISIGVYLATKKLNKKIGDLE